ncbi:prephenate dehydratase [Balneatrix alpica]|uniref:prephenate dehydratase n=1 Tax=Balneatrix alpica TaxID=75684 RepID=A0ABV5Z6T3_9GAMM|nr:prephenate dehydratase [Balneatrix alpica]
MSTPSVIAYQGHEGAYSHLACRQVFPDMPALACSSFVAAMEKVENSEAALAMIPLENSTAGRVEEIYRQMPRTSLHIVGEHFEPVNHCLLVRPGTQLTDLKFVCSHPQALAQCDQHIKALGLASIAKLDTAGAALEVSQRTDHQHAAIASRLAAELYGLEILQENFQDMQGNTTRFLILSKDNHTPTFDPSKAYITSILFTVRNIPAALYKALGGFATNGVNLIKLESYMTGGTLNVSQFHIDIAAHTEEHNMQLALQELGFFAKDMRILGCYEAHAYRRLHALVD